MSSRHVVLTALLVVGLSASGCPGCGGPGPDGGVDGGDGDAGPGTGLVLGPRVEVASAVVADEGGSVVVDEGPLAGLEIVVDEAAFDGERTFTIAQQEIERHPWGEDVGPLTPVIEIDFGDGYADVPLFVRVPAAHDSSTRFAMGFFVHEEDGARLEGIPVGADDDEVVTLITRHFSKFLVSEVLITRLVAAVDTGFDPNLDTWPMPNLGSFISPDGHCAGQSLSAMTDFLTRRREDLGAEPLHSWGDGTPTKKTPGFTFDDAQGWRIASAVQEQVDWDNLDVVLDRAFQDALASPRVTYHAFAYAMLVTGEPQYVSIRQEGGGHALVAYKKPAVATSSEVHAPIRPANAWTCDASAFGGDDGCDCGCGLPDPDCADGSASSCDTCDLIGSCSGTDDPPCPGDVLDEDNALCALDLWTPESVSFAPARLYVADPNFPDAAPDDRVLVFNLDDDVFLPFPARANATEATSLYTKVAYLGRTALIDEDLVKAELMKRPSSTGGDDRFPAYTLTFATPVDAPAEVVGSELTVEHEVIAFGVEPPLATPFPMRLRAVDEDRYQQIGQKLSEYEVAVPLELGTQTIGLFVVGGVGGRWSVIDFRWITVERTAPVVGPVTVSTTLALPSPASAVAADATLVVVGDEDPGLTLVPVANGTPTGAAVPAGALGAVGHGTARGVALDGDFAYVAKGTFNLVDISGAPVVRATVGLNADLDDVVARGSVALVVGPYTYDDTLSPFAVIDVTEPTVEKERVVGGFDLPAAVHHLATDATGALTVAAGRAGEVFFIDTSDPESAVLRASVDEAGTGEGAVAIEGTRVYVAGPGLRVFEAADPASPVRLAPYDQYDDAPLGIDVVSGRAFLVGPHVDGGSFFAVFDVTGDGEPPVVDVVTIDPGARAVLGFPSFAYVVHGGAAPLLTVLSY